MLDIGSFTTMPTPYATSMSVAIRCNVSRILVLLHHELIAACICLP